MKIYFAHPTKIYNTEHELNCMNKIKELYPDAEIINPKDIIIQKNDTSTSYENFMSQMNKYYFPQIKNCNVLIVARNKSGKINPGVQKEIKYAIDNNIKIEYLDVKYPEDNRETMLCEDCEKQIKADDVQNKYNSDESKSYICNDCFERDEGIEKQDHDIMHRDIEININEPIKITNNKSEKNWVSDF